MTCRLIYFSAHAATPGRLNSARKKQAAARERADFITRRAASIYWLERRRSAA